MSSHLPRPDRIGSGTGIDNHFAVSPQIGIREPSPGFDDLNDQIEAARVQSLALDEKRQSIQDKIAKKEKKKEKRSKKQRSDSATSSGSNGYTNGTTNCTLTSSSSSSSSPDSPSTLPNGNSKKSTGHKMSDVVELNNGSTGDANATVIIPPEMLPTDRVLEEDAKDRQEEEERRRTREPPVVFVDIDAKAELEALVKLVDGQLSKEEETAIEELHQYLIEGEGSWALGDNFLTFVGRIFQDANISTETRVHLLRALAYAALKDDVILLLHQDRRDHVLMNYALEIDRRAPEEQQGLALFVSHIHINTSIESVSMVLTDCPIFGADVQPVREHQLVRVAAVHQRVDAEQPADVQHSGHDQGGRPLSAGRVSHTAGHWHRYHPQSGLQGGKNCGLYRFATLWVSFLTFRFVRSTPLEFDSQRSECMLSMFYFCWFYRLLCLCEWKQLICAAS